MQFQKHIKLVIAGLFLIVNTVMYSASRYWIAGSLANWDAATTTNWSATSGGLGGASVPGSGDAVFFDSHGVGNCTITATVNVAQITVSGYTGTITQGSNAVTVGTSGATFSSGTFAGGTSADITINGPFTLSGTSFTATSANLNFNGTVTYSSGTFTHNNGTVNFSSTGAQTIPAWNYSVLTSSSTGTRALASSGTIGVQTSFTPGTNSYTTTGSTIDYNGSGPEGVAAFNYYNLTCSSSGSRSLASIGTIGVFNTFNPRAGTNTYTIIGSTINYNGTGAQNIPAFSYTNLTISQARGTASVTLANSGTIGVFGTFSNTATFTTGAFVNTGSTIDYNGTAAQTVGAFNYNNLTISNAHTTNNITLASSGVIGVAGTFSNTATFTSGGFVNTSSTVNYNGTGAQTIIALNYYNLVISGAHTTNSITLASSGTIGIAKVFLPVATFSSGGYINTGSTVDYNGTLPESISAFPYNNLTSSSTGDRAFASAGSVKIAGTFTKGTNTYTNVGIGGQSFSLLYSGITTNVGGCTTIDANTAFIIGDGGVILKTTDGGVTWGAQTSGTSINLRAIAFTDANNGIVVGASGLVLKTANGGTTWTSATPTAQIISGVYYVSSSIVFISLGNGTLLKSTNGGTSWGSPVSVSSSGLYGMYFTDANTGYVVGNLGSIYKTTNGGTSWTAQTSGVSSSYILFNVYFTDSYTGYIEGGEGATFTSVVLKTTNGGATWTTITTSPRYFTTMSAGDANTIYISGGDVSNDEGYIMKTTDAGATWATYNTGTPRLGGIKMLNSGIGYTGGLDGAIVKIACCTDGGTVEYNGTGAQTVAALNYNNLTISGARTTNNVTLASSGTIGIAGSLSNTATFSSGAIVNTSSTIDLDGNQPQTISAFTFNNLTASNTGKKSVTGALTVQGTLNLTNGEVALTTNTITMSSNVYSVVTRTKGYISTVGGGYLTRPTASVNSYLFPLGNRTINDSADLFSIALTPGKTAAQSFSAGVDLTNTGFTLSYNRTLYGIGTGGATTVLLTITTSSYNPLQLQFNIDNSANIVAVNVTDQNDNTLKTLPSVFYTITSGCILTIPNIYKLALMYSKLILNSNMNWKSEISYDGQGYPVEEKVAYADLMGRSTQTLSRNVADNTVLAQQTIYDNYGRPALQTLPAPVGSVMTYQGNFITNTSGIAYTYTDYDRPVTTFGYTGEINTPNAIQNTIPGTLGAYYSDNGSEAFVPTSSYPYARREFTSDPAGGTKRDAKAGNEYRMGAGHETKGYSMISGDELKYIFGTNQSFKDSIDVSNKLTNYSISITGGILATKTISTDADGKEVISYSIGGLPIATCYTGISGGCTMTTVTNTMVYAGTGSTDVHIPAADKATVKVPLPQYVLIGTQTVASADISYRITDLNTNNLLVNGTDYTINASTRVVTFLGSYASGSSVFRISFAYSQTLLTFLAGAGVAPPDAAVTYSLDYSRWSVNYYDLAGHLRKSVSPKGINCSSAGTITMATTYDYSSKGQLIASLDPDKGLSEATYDDEGKPRFSQTAVEEDAGTFSYTNYDTQGRPVETGEYITSNNGSASVFFQNYYGAYSELYTSNTPTSSIINNTDNTGMRALDCNDQNNVYYYPLVSGEGIPSGYSYKSSYAARYLMGKVCKTKNAESATWYGYNQMGKTVFTMQQLLDADFIRLNATLDSQIKTVDYTYNLYNGTLTDQTYQKNETTEKLKHNFTYDGALRLTEVDVAIASGSPTTQAKYYYYKTGALKRKELGDQLQGIDYVYTINGQLKSINHPALDSIKDPGQDGWASGANASFGKDVFGLTLDYHTADYTRTGSNMIKGGQAVNVYNGMISAMHYKTRAVTNSVNNGADYIDYGGGNQQRVTTGVSEELMNQYAYDDEYRLSTVNFGKFDNAMFVYTVNSNNCYKEFGNSATGGINYDANGNITKLKRNAYNGTLGLLMDNLGYTYTSNTNQLASILDSATSTYSTDIKAATSKTFSYNFNGQMTASQAEGLTGAVYYNTGLTKSTTFGAFHKVDYRYDDRGQKIKTKYKAGILSGAIYTWYISDAGGNPLAVYEYDSTVVSPVFKLVDQPVYGAGRIGTYHASASTPFIDYEITDHLGNVRATIKGISTGVYQLTTRTDYYAFGGVQPGRSYNLNTYRFNYQGQENAPGTNWEAFDLRMHNSDLGRWLTPDPKGQFYSPYISMGNNPVSGTDPDGGWVDIDKYHPNMVTREETAQQRQKDLDNDYEEYMHVLESTATDYTVLKQEEIELRNAWLAAKSAITVEGWAPDNGVPNPLAPGPINHGTMGMGHDQLLALQVVTNTGYGAQEMDKISDLTSGGEIYKDIEGQVFAQNGKGEIGQFFKEMRQVGATQGGKDDFITGIFFKTIGGGKTYLNGGENTNYSGEDRSLGLSTPILINYSSQSIFYKPEGGKGVADDGASIEIMPMGYRRTAFDGVATCLHTNQVFKVSDGGDAWVSPSGEVNTFYQGLENNIFAEPDGWKGTDWLKGKEYNWGNLFKSANTGIGYDWNANDPYH